jgi:hypothetical protein
MAAITTRCALTWLLAGTATASADAIADFSTPENALRTLSAAWERRDIDAIVDAQDFMLEAESMIRKFDDMPKSDPEFTRELAAALELTYRREFARTIAAEPATLDCQLTERQNHSATLVRLSESCRYASGSSYVRSLYFAKTDRGWRLVTLWDRD